MQTGKKNKITKVLKTVLNKKAIQKLSVKGDIPKISPEGKPGNLRRFTAEVAIYCGHRVERALKRNLLKKEFYFLAAKVEGFLKESYKD